MQVSARKMKRTKREMLLQGERENKIEIELLRNQFEEMLRTIVVEIPKFQREVLSIKNALKRRGFLDELEIAQERTAILELEKMEKQAIILPGGEPE
jgi:hypothetical protein